MKRKSVKKRPVKNKKLRIAVFSSIFVVAFAAFFFLFFRNTLFSDEHVYLVNDVDPAIGLTTDEDRYYYPDRDLQSVQITRTQSDVINCKTKTSTYQYPTEGGSLVFSLFNEAYWADDQVIAICGANPSTIIPAGQTSYGCTVSPTTPPSGSCETKRKTIYAFRKFQQADGQYSAFTLTHYNYHYSYLCPVPECKGTA